MKSLIILSCALVLAVAEKSAMEEFTDANNLFAQSVYKEVAKTKYDNFLVSPFSAEAALAFVQSGCIGESGEEIRKVLRLPNNKTKVESAMKILIPKFKSNEFYSLETANKMYVKKGFSIKEDFKAVARSVYSSETETVDFAKNVEAANTMNKWVEEKTNNKIKNLISSDDLSEDTRSVLINALYFKANWSIEFTTTVTKKKEFYTTPSDVKNVDFMHHYEQYFNYYESPNLKAQFLELPFQGNDASMVIVLPNEKDGIVNLEKNLGQVFESHQQLQNTFVNVAIPKFKIETLIDFKEILKNLGVQRVFDPLQADLSGIGGGKGDLYVDKVAQKTFIDVNEGGVEAAAATFLLIFTRTDSVDHPKNFSADHPFIFYIRNKDVVIFIGRVTDPTKS